MTKIAPTLSLKDGSTSPLPSSHMESADYYDDVIRHLTARWRIICCKDRIQWIIQKKEASHAAPGEALAITRVVTA